MELVAVAVTAGVVFGIFLARAILRITSRAVDNLLELAAHLLRGDR